MKIYICSDKREKLPNAYLKDAALY